MDKKNLSCVYCNKIIDDDDELVFCPECGAPYHRECYLKAGECIYKEKHATGYDWQEENIPNETVNEIPQEQQSNRYGAAFIDAEVVEETSETKTDDSKAQNSSNGYYAYNPGRTAKDEDNSPEAQFMKEYSKAMQAAEMLDKRTVDGYTKKEIVSVVGPSGNTYFNNFYAHPRKNGRKNFSFSISAFFLQFIHFFYRKMYIVGIPFLLFFLLTSGINIMKMFNDISTLSLALNGIISVAEFYAKASTGFLFLDKLSVILSYVSPFVSIFAGFLANGLYQKQVYKIIDKTRSEETQNMPSYYITLERKGGVNKTFVVIFFVAMAIITFAISFLVTIY